MSKKADSPSKRPYKRAVPTPAYILSLPYGIKMNVLKSANAWWMDQFKVFILIESLGREATLEQACKDAGISLRQYKYFVKLHPQFVKAKSGFKQSLLYLARKTVGDVLSAEATTESAKARQIRLACWYLERKKPDEFGRPSRRRGFSS